jgi:hypothetical protein
MRAELAFTLRYSLIDHLLYRRQGTKDHLVILIRKLTRRDDQGYEYQAES